MESFEKRVPKDVWGFVWSMGYRKVPPESKRAWLQDHFFLPSGWPECRDVARIESVTRMRKYCWQALADVVTLGISTLGIGRPRTRSAKQQTLYYVMHREEPLRPEWQWPLVNLLIAKKKLSAGEQLWLAGRAGVLPRALARLFCIELAVFCADQTGLHRGLVDEACDMIRVAHEVGALSAATMRRRLTAKLPKHPATLVFLEVMGSSPSKSVRKTLGQAARACPGKVGNLRETFAKMLGPVIVERTL